MKIFVLSLLATGLFSVANAQESTLKDFGQWPDGQYCCTMNGEVRCGTKLTCDDVQSLQFLYCPVGQKLHCTHGHDVYCSCS